MIKLYDTGVYLLNGRDIVADERELEARTGRAADREAARRGTMAWSILRDHNTSGSMDELKLKFDSMTSHDITYVGIIQTARAS